MSNIDKTSNDGNNGEQRKRKREAVPIMEECDLTEEERRQIRRLQRRLHKEMEIHDKIEVSDIRSRNNIIYEKVRYTREAVLDSDNLALMATKAVKQTERMIQAPRYDANRFVRKLVQKGRNPQTGSFDWVSLGVEAGICFNGVPSSVSFLNGPLTEGKPLKVMHRAARGGRAAASEEIAVEERPEDVKGHTTRNADSLCAVQTSMIELEKTLHKKVDERYKEAKRHLIEVYGENNIPPPMLKKLKKAGAEVCAIQFLFNPDSFTQTVENIFHFAFCIKKGSAAIAVRKEGYYNQDGLKNKGGPRIKYVPPNRSDQPTPKQSIVALTMKDWREMREAYQVEQGDLPHRKTTKREGNNKSNKKPAPRKRPAAAAAAASPSDSNQSFSS